MGSSVKTWKLECNIEIGGQRRVTKIIKWVKDYKEKLEQWGLTTLLERRMRSNLTETLKIINGISNYGRDF